MSESDVRPESVGAFRFRWWMIPLALLVLLFLGCAVLRFHYERKVRELVAAEQAKGLPMTPQELDAWYEYPLGENAADSYAKAFDKLVYWEEEHEGYGWLPLVAEAKAPPRGEPLPPEMRKVIEAYLAENEDALKLLRYAAEVEACRFPINLANSYRTELPALSRSRHSVNLSGLSTMRAVAAGEANRAASAVHTALRLGWHLKDEPILVSQLVRIACELIAVHSLEKAVNRIALPPDGLQQLMADLKNAEETDSMHRAFVGERVIGHDAVQDIARHPEEMADYFYMPFRYPPFDNRTGMKCLGLVYSLSGFAAKDEYVYLQHMDKLIHYASLSLPERISATCPSADNVPSSALISWLLLPALERAFVQDAVRFTSLRTARAGLAVLLYKEKTGRLPDSLEALVPGEIDAVPIDPYDGKALKYRVLNAEQGHFVVYSVNEDGNDDGGKECVSSAPGERYFRKRDEDDPETTDITFTVGPSPELAEWTTWLEEKRKDEADTAAATAAGTEAEAGAAEAPAPAPVPAEGE